MPLVRDYMSHFDASENDPFNGDYKEILAAYLIDVAAPKNALGPADVARQIYAASGVALTALLFWLTTPGLNPDEDPGRIVLLHSISQLSIRMGRPAKKWDSKEFPPTGDVVADTVSLANWDPRYINLLQNPVNVPIYDSINTSLAATPATLLLDPVADVNTRSTSI